jgi:hypothetical protein
MPEPVVPNYVSDPPIDRGAYHSDVTARRWLTDLGLEGRGTDQWVGKFKLPELIRRLAAALDTSQDRIEAILDESAFQYRLKHTLFEWFDPVPHETDARQKLVRLARKTYDLPKRAGHGRLWIYPAHPDHVDDSIAFLRRAFPDSDGLIEDWLDWKSTWRSLVARNPPLELRTRMGEVFDNNDFVSWNIGRERLFDDWLARGTRDPMPFNDLRGIVTEAYYKRLCELREASGGWFYSRDDIGIVFVPRAEWERISGSWPRVLEQVCASLQTDKGP